MLDFFSQLFSTATFMPHGHCYLWRPEILWLHVVSDSIISLSYFTIPFALIHLVRKRRDLAFNWVFVMFSIFIMACGTTHLISIWTVWEPVYRLDGLVKGLTAFASLATALALWPLIPKILQLPSPSQLEEANAALRREIIERRRAEQTLAERNQVLVEAERFKANFIANVSHELRTPLTLILAPTETLMLKSTELTPLTRQTIGTIHNNALRLLQLVNGLLDFEKLEAQQVEVKREPLDIKQLSSHLLAEFEALMQRKEISGSFIAPPLPLMRMMDRFLFERIVFNLLSNAVKFTPAGGRVILRIEIQDADRLQIIVEDTGCGIPQIDQQRLFRKFQQLEASSTRRFEGTGLGLALVKEFAELLDGSVGVESEEGKGSRFFVEVSAPTAEGVSPIAAHRQTNWQSTTLESSPIELASQNPDLPLLLIAEDNRELATHIQILLKDLCRTVVVGDGESALAIVKQQNPVLILSDVMMPERDGISLCRELKNDFSTTKIPIILLSALTHREALLKGWEVGADEYLFKPFHPTELITRVRSILQRRAFMLKAEEHEEQALREKLLREVAEAQVTDLRKIESELLRINRLKDEFLATISHELRTPMVAILGWSELLYHNDLDSSEYPLAFEAIFRNAQSQAQMIESLLDISRIITGKIQMDRQPLEMAPLLNEAKATLQLSAEKRALQIRTDLAQDLPLIQGDPLRLKQVILNLMNNAIKFSHEGGLIDIKVSEQDKQLEFKITDQGEGIDPHFLPHVFESFAQEDQSDTRKHGGLGLGLAIVKHIVELHEGSLSVASAGKGMGASFTVRLPLSQEGITLKKA